MSVGTRSSRDRRSSSAKTYAAVVLIDEASAPPATSVSKCGVLRRAGPLAADVRTDVMSLLNHGEVQFIITATCGPTTGRASAWAMARLMPMVYRRKVDAATH